MTFPLTQIAALVGGKLVGDRSRVCHGANPPAEASGDQITMLDDVRHLESVIDSQAMAIVTPEPIDVKQSQIIVSDPHRAFTEIVAMFRPAIGDELPALGIDPTALIDASALIHPGATIGAGTSVGAGTRIMPGVVVMPECEIGAGCVLHANVTLYEYTKIDDRVTLHAGCVIGAHGFGYRLESGRHVPTAQVGYVHIESDVEVGAVTTIDRGTYGATRIGQGTKIDNQVMIGHNCQIGRHNLLCSQVGIAGSSSTGDYVILAGQVGLKDHISLGDRTVVGAQAGVMEDCEGDKVYLGSPATEQREQMQIMAVQRRLPEMRREIKRIRRDIESLLDRSIASNEPPHRHDSRAA